MKNKKILHELESIKSIVDNNISNEHLSKLEIFRINVKDVSILGRSTQGVTLMRTNDGGKVVSIEKISADEGE